MNKVIAIALAATSLLALPASANASGRHQNGDRSYNNGSRQGGYAYRGSGYRNYAPSYGYGYRTGGYGNYYPSYGYQSYGYGGYPAYGYQSYGYGSPYGYGYSPAYYGGYGGYGAYGGYGYQCGNPAAGVAIGGVAGAVLGSQVANDGGRYNRYGYRGYNRGGDGAAGAIVGGVLGAIVGGAIASGNC